MKIYSSYIISIIIENPGAQWLSGGVLDSRPKGRGFEPHRRHYVVSLCKTRFLLSTGSTQEDRSDVSERLLTGSERIKSNKQKNNRNPCYI